MRVVAAPYVFLGAPGDPFAPSVAPRSGAASKRELEVAEVLRDAAIALDGDHVVAVGRRDEIEARHGKSEALDAVLLPALVNAHTHLELSHLARRIPGGTGL
ncbi:MAG: amidohydrolase, partial [Anaeromyxobacteraceae bacterium]